jgi:nitrite reductase/ring-hydroxylating ferredoxin subunit
VERYAPKFAVCPSGELANGQHRKLSLVFEGREEEFLLLRFEGVVYAYLNRCVHMPRRLDCEEAQVFDYSGRYLRSTVKVQGRCGLFKCRAGVQRLKDINPKSQQC